MRKFRNIDYEDPHWFSNGVNMIDCDPDFALRVLSRNLSSREDILSSVGRYFDAMFKNSKVTDMSFAVFQQISFVETESMDFIYRKLANMDERGELDRDGRWSYYKERAPRLYRAFKEFDLDWAEVAISECRVRGVRPWLYFRMNDLHAVDSDESIFHDSFFFKAKENGWLIGNETYGHPLGTSGSIHNLYDFSHAEVREWLLTYLDEIIMRYDVFGYELDFMRNIYCFDYLRAEPGYQEYMNDFIRRVRDIITRAEEKFGHDIKLAVRLGHSVENNFVYGFDVKTWIKEGLVDALIPSCEEVCNSGTDVREWRRVIGDDVALFIGYDSHVIRWLVCEAECIHAMEEKHIKAFAARYFNLGANGVYFNNYYAVRSFSTGTGPEAADYTIESCAKDIDREYAESGLRTLVVTHEDIVPIGCKGYKPLPIRLDRGKATITLNIGKVREGEHFYVTVGYDRAEFEMIQVSLGELSPVSCTVIPVVPDKVEGHYYDEKWNFLESAVLVRYEFDGFSSDGDFDVVFDGENIGVVYLEVTATPDELK